MIARSSSLFINFNADHYSKSAKGIKYQSLNTCWSWQDVNKGHNLESCSFRVMSLFNLNFKVGWWPLTDKRWYCMQCSCFFCYICLLIYYAIVHVWLQAVGEFLFWAYYLIYLHGLMYSWIWTAVTSNKHFITESYWGRWYHWWWWWQVQGSGFFSWTKFNFKKVYNSLFFVYVLITVKKWLYILSAGFGQHSLSTSITLLKATEVDDIIENGGNKYKDVGVSSELVFKR